MRAAPARLSLILLFPPLLAFGCGTQKNNAAPTLTVRTYNHAALPAPTLERAERLADDIFHQAGVELEWVECGVSPEDKKKFAACDKVLERRSPSVVLKLIPESMEVGLPRPAEKFAIAIPSTVFVFWERIHNAAEMSGIPEDLILGTILPHELGHEVLGNLSHVDCGIMKPILRPDDFGATELGRMHFCTEQARQLRIILSSGKLYE
jgi:hypothetical protein